jgi:type II secretion system protein G
VLGINKKVASVEEQDSILIADSSREVIVSGVFKRKAVGRPIKLNVIKDKSGFTLLELLVVVGILAALVALALPYYQDYVNQSKLTAAEADLQTFKKALAMYDQLEPAMFKEADLRTLIGKYLQDYRANSTQEMPMDPWGNDYQIDVQEGVLYSMGPNGTDDSTVTILNRESSGDDIMVSWKAPFIVASARVVNNTTIEITFSRKVEDISAMASNVVVTGIVPAVVVSANTVQRVSDTSYRIILTGTLVAATPKTSYAVTVSNTLVAQDGKTGFHKRPEDNSNGNVVTFEY